MECGDAVGAKVTGVGVWEEMGKNVCLYVFSWLDRESLLQCHMVCKWWFNVTIANYLWRPLCYRDHPGATKRMLGVLSDRTAGSDDEGSWKAAYFRMLRGASYDHLVKVCFIGLTKRESKLVDSVIEPMLYGSEDPPERRAREALRLVNSALLKLQLWNYAGLVGGPENKAALVVVYVCTVSALNNTLFQSMLASGRCHSPEAAVRVVAVDDTNGATVDVPTKVPYGSVNPEQIDVVVVPEPPRGSAALCQATLRACLRQIMEVDWDAVMTAAIASTIDKPRKQQPCCLQ